MDAFLTWLQELPYAVWIAESDSKLGYPLILSLHTVGVALTAGSAAVIGLRILGVARPMPLSALQKLSPYFWSGFALNVVTGTILFMAAAVTEAHRTTYYVKLLLLLLAMATAFPIAAAIGRDRARDDRDLTHSTKVFAALSLALWAAVITTGRLIAYLG